MMAFYGKLSTPTGGCHEGRRGYGGTAPPFSCMDVGECGHRLIAAQSGEIDGGPEIAWKLRLLAPIGSKPTRTP